MERLQLLSREGKEVLIIDVSACLVPEALQVIKQAEPLIRKRSSKSLRTLTDVTNSRYTKEWVDAVKVFADGNEPFVVASAVVGVTGLGQVLLGVVQTFTGRAIKPFPDRESALQWLVKQ